VIQTISREGLCAFSVFVYPFRELRIEGPKQKTTSLAGGSQELIKGSYPDKMILK
jgi:hypothetical protein